MQITTSQDLLIEYYLDVTKRASIFGEHEIITEDLLNLILSLVRIYKETKTGGDSLNRVKKHNRFSRSEC